MAPETKVDLHGIKGQPFPDFNEGVSYLERVTIPDVDAARQAFAAEYGANPDEVDPLPIYMRWVTEIDRDTQPELDNCEAPCWIVCFEHDADAVPFWKDGA